MGSVVYGGFLCNECTVEALSRSDHLQMAVTSIEFDHKPCSWTRERKGVLTLIVSTHHPGLAEQPAEKTVPPIPDQPVALQ